LVILIVLNLLNSSKFVIPTGTLSKFSGYISTNAINLFFVDHFLKIRKGTEMSITVGAKAPQFTLVDTTKTPRSPLSESAGKKVVLLFYPGAFTGVCDKEMCIS